MESSFTPFTYLMIFLGVVVVIIIILLLTINWNSTSTTSGNVVSMLPTTTKNVESMANVAPVKVETSSIVEPLSSIIEIDSTESINLLVPEQSTKPSEDITFSTNSVKLLENLFNSIDSIVIQQSAEIDHDKKVKDAANVLANELCDSSNADTLVRSYVNLNSLLKDYTKVSRDKYLDRSAFSELSSGIADDRSISPSMLSDGSDGSNSLSDIKRQAAILTMIINGIYFKCLDLSSGSNDNFKTYLRTLNTMLFRYSELLANASWKEANMIKDEALKLAAGAILTNKDN